MIRILKWTLGIVLALAIAFAISWVIYMPKAHERGIWISPATGNIIDLGRFKADLYNQTSVSCMYDSSFPAHLGLVYLMVGASIEVQDDNLDLVLASAVDKSRFERAEVLPAKCLETPDSSPKAVFDTMWAAMDENYALSLIHI